MSDPEPSTSRSSGLTCQMSRAPRRHPRTDCLARRLHLDVIRRLRNVESSTTSFVPVDIEILAVLERLKAETSVICRPDTICSAEQGLQPITLLETRCESLDRHPSASATRHC